jgi:hypothetical protein
LKERILQIDNKESMLSDGFEPDLPVKLIIHGFIDTGFEAWVKVSLIHCHLGHGETHQLPITWSRYTRFIVTSGSR